MDIRVHEFNIESLIRYLKSNEGTFHVSFSLELAHGKHRGSAGTISNIEVVSVKNLDEIGVAYDIDIYKLDEYGTNIKVLVSIPIRFYKANYEALKYYPELATIQTLTEEFVLDLGNAQHSFEINFNNTTEDSGNIFDNIQRRIDNYVRYVIKKDINAFGKDMVEKIKNRHYDDILPIPESRIKPYIKKIIYNK